MNSTTPGLNIKTEATDSEISLKSDSEDGYWRTTWRKVSHDPTGVIGLVLVGALIVLALLAPYVAPFDPVFQQADGLTLDGNPRPPSREYLLGTDGYGRDQLSRLMYGARISLAVGIASTLIAAFFGILIGASAGMATHWRRSGIMRVVDVVLSLPTLLFAILLLSISTTPVMPSLIVIIGIGGAAYLSRIVFAQVSSLREREFVVVARASGVGWFALLRRHVLPQILPSVLVFCSLAIAGAILAEAGLSYVGIGIRPPAASWGNMLSSGQELLAVAPWLVICPALAIVLAMLGFGLLGDSLRDAMDPTLERKLQGLGTFR